jgi:hypothetical protein
VLVILVGFQLNLNFLDRLKKKAEISNFVKICSVGEMFHADRQTDVTKLKVAFGNFANSPKNCYQPQEHKNTVTFCELANDSLPVL